MNGGSCGHELVITGADLAVLAKSLLGGCLVGEKNYKVLV